MKRKLQISLDTADQHAVICKEFCRDTVISAEAIRSNVNGVQSLIFHVSLASTGNGHPEEL